MQLARLIDRLSNFRYIAWCIALLALLAALAFTFVIFPRASGSLNLVLDPDHHGNLGFGILKYHSLSSYPDPAILVDRGPGYPAFIALVLALSGESWPYSVQIGQCLLFAATCGLVFWTARTLWNRRAAFVSALITAVYPLLIWYTSRIWVEALIIFLFTALVAAAIYASRRPSVWSGGLVGAIIAVGALSKTTFLVFLALIPIAFLLLKPKRLRIGPVVAIVFIGAVLIAPWTYRNWVHTGRFIPVNVMFGWNCMVGDAVVTNFHKSPMSLGALWDMSIDDIVAIREALPAELPRHEKAVLADGIYTRICMTRYRENPGFFLKKLVYNAFLYWTLAEGPMKSAVVGVMQLVLLALFIVSGVRLLKRNGLRSIHGVIYAMVLAYYVLHLPVLSEFRYSVVLIPTMLLYGVGALLASGKEKKDEGRSTGGVG